MDSIQQALVPASSSSDRKRSLGSTTWKDRVKQAIRDTIARQDVYWVGVATYVKEAEPGLEFQWSVYARMRPEGGLIDQLFGDEEEEPEECRHLWFELCGEHVLPCEEAFDVGGDHLDDQEVEEKLFKDAVNCVAVYFGKENDSFNSVGGFALVLCLEVSDLIKDATDGTNLEEEVVAKILAARSEMESKSSADREEVLLDFLNHLQRNRTDLFREITKEASLFSNKRCKLTADVQRDNLDDQQREFEEAVEQEGVSVNVITH